jgi:S-adenosylmethionine:tRNA ribosyltransferase-isomerase
MYSLNDYNYDLPEALVAQKPADRRDQSRLLYLNRASGELAHHGFGDIYDFFHPTDLLVVNNTEVIPGRLLGRKETGGRAEVLILDYAGGRQSLASTGAFICNCLVNSSKRPKIGATILFDDGLSATVIAFNAGVYEIRFVCEDDFEAHMYRIGRIPLPPYIKRSDNGGREEDRIAYQTIYASQKGAIAAPTAGLHFTSDLMTKIKAKGVEVVPITLHVGYGTFLPVRVDDVRDHVMHSERYFISDDAARKISRAKMQGRRVIAVGTTSVRTLEYAAQDSGAIAPGGGQCDLFIYPGYKFKMVDAMLTNFHLPQSTLLMLVSAFAGRENVLQAYRQAIEKGYRFYSYGDGMFIE